LRSLLEPLLEGIGSHIFGIRLFALCNAADSGDSSLLALPLHRGFKFFSVYCSPISNSPPA
jgi:hypothetical protein